MLGSPDRFHAFVVLQRFRQRCHPSPGASQRTGPAPATNQSPQCRLPDTRILSEVSPSGGGERWRGNETSLVPGIEMHTGPRQHLHLWWYLFVRVRACACLCVSVFGRCMDISRGGCAVWVGRVHCVRYAVPRHGTPTGRARARGASYKNQIKIPTTRWAAQRFCTNVLWIVLSFAGEKNPQVSLPYATPVHHTARPPIACLE